MSAPLDGLETIFAGALKFIAAGTDFGLTQVAYISTESIVSSATN